MSDETFLGSELTPEDIAQPKAEPAAMPGEKPIAQQAEEAAMLLMRSPAAHGIPDHLVNTVNLKTLQHPVPIVTVSEPAAWPPASLMKFKVKLIYGGKPTSFLLRGVSDAEWLYIQSTNVLPEPRDKEEESDPEFLAVHNRNTDLRRIALFELVLGEKVPGSTIDKKVRWLHGQCTVSIQSLFDMIQAVSLGLEVGDAEPHYKMHLVDSPSECEFSGFANLATDPSYSFIRGRKGQDYISVFALNAITEEVKHRIEADNRMDPPPTRPGKNLDGSFDYANAQPWHDEPVYKARTERVKAAKTKAYVSHCLPFSLPDDDWLGARMSGDILRMKLFIQQELLDPTIRTTFF